MTSVARGMLPVDARPSGSWYGAFELTSCTGGTFGCRLAPESFMLRLGNDGSGVLQIQTTVWGSQSPPIAVDVARQSASCRPDFDSGRECLIDATIAVTVDAVDRLHGSMTYWVQGVGSAGQPFALEATVSLDGLARWHAVQRGF